MHYRYRYRYHQYRLSVARQQPSSRERAHEAIVPADIEASSLLLSRGPTEWLVTFEVPYGHISPCVTMTTPRLCARRAMKRYREAGPLRSPSTLQICRKKTRTVLTSPSCPTFRRSIEVLVSTVNSLSSSISSCQKAPGHTTYISGL